LLCQEPQLRLLADGQMTEVDGGDLRELLGQ
jgi:hypothetical protein